LKIIYILTGKAMTNRDEILNILKNYKNRNLDKYDILELGLFGSVARNQASSSSDVDICIKTKTPDMFALVHIKEELQKLLSNHIDIVRIRDKMNPYLKNRINKEAIYV
jgi:predicted nucleotidyltransferase